MKKTTKKRLIELLELLSGSVLPIIFWISVIFGFDLPYIAVLTIIAAVLHELGHYIAIACFCSKSVRIRGHTSGFRIRRSSSLSYLREIVILLSGPTANLLVFLLTLPLGDAMDGYLKVLGYVSLVTGLSNLMPIEGYDGYGAICELFKYLGRDHLIRKLEAASFLFCISITFVALYLIERFSEGWWIFGLFFFTTLSKLAKFGKYDIFER